MGVMEQKITEVLVDKIMPLQNHFHSTPANSDKWHLLKTEIEKIERQIDQLVYKLYDLTDDEIKIVAGNL